MNKNLMTLGQVFDKVEAMSNRGFRRNLWGVRPLGIVASPLGVLVIGTVAITYFISDPPIPRLLWLYGIVEALLLVSWLPVFNKA